MSLCTQSHFSFFYSQVQIIIRNYYHPGTCTVNLIRIFSSFLKFYTMSYKANFIQVLVFVQSPQNNSYFYSLFMREDCHFLLRQNSTIRLFVTKSFLISFTHLHQKEVQLQYPYLKNYLHIQFFLPPKQNLFLGESVNHSFLLKAYMHFNLYKQKQLIHYFIQGFQVYRLLRFVFYKTIHLQN